MIEKLVERKLIKIDKVLCEFSKEYHAQSAKNLEKNMKIGRIHLQRKRLIY